MDFHGKTHLKPIDFGDFKVPVPIFQGGMGIGISMSSLAAAVAACGGVGVISSAQIGFREPDFRSNTVEANIRALKNEIKTALKSISEIRIKGAIGVNIMCASNNYAEYVKASVEAGAQLIISGAGLPTNLPGLCTDRKVKLVPIVSSARAAKLMIKAWMKRYSRFPDAIVFEGPDAGGHLGFKQKDLKSESEKFYDTIGDIKNEIVTALESVSQECVPYGRCPLIAAGGIFSSTDVRKAIASGADGVQLGTRFVTTYECDAPESFKRKYLECNKDDIVIIQSPVGMPGRAIKNKFVELSGEGKLPVKECNHCLTACNPHTAPYCITKALIDSAKGDSENGLVFCGSNAYRTKKMMSVKELMRELSE